MVGSRHKGNSEQLQRHMAVIAIGREMRRSRTMPGKLTGAKVQVKSPANIGRLAVGDEPSIVRMRKPALSHLLNH